MKELTYYQAPHDWAICFQDDCPLKDTCLRHAIARLAPDSLTHHSIVLPAARHGDRCSLFATKEPVQFARGMKSLLPRAARGELRLLREGLYAIFGSTSRYYLFREGKYPITPQQQQSIQALFRRHGINSAPHYDSIIEEFYFPKP